MRRRRSGSPGVRWLTTPVASTRFHAPYCWPARAGKPNNARPHRPDRIEIRTGLCIKFFVGRSNGELLPRMRQIAPINAEKAELRK